MSQSPASPMPSTQSDGTDQQWIAQQVPVHANGGILLIGWAIRRDTVLVEASGLVAPHVIIDGQEVTPIDTHETTPALGSWVSVTALELPEGTLDVVGERFLPRLGSAPPRPDVMPAHMTFWCRMFPRMRGC